MLPARAAPGISEQAHKREAANGPKRRARRVARAACDGGMLVLSSGRIIADKAGARLPVAAPRGRWFTTCSMPSSVLATIETSGCIGFFLWLLIDRSWL